MAEAFPRSQEPPPTNSDRLGAFVALLQRGIDDLRAADCPIPQQLVVWREVWVEAAKFGVQHLIPAPPGPGIAQYILAHMKGQTNVIDHMGLLVGWCREQMNATASAQRKDGPAVPDDKPPLDDEEIAILQALNASAPRLLTVYAIESDSRVSRRTLTSKIPRLLQLGFAARPKGPRGGTAITPQGRDVLQGIGQAER